MGVIFERKKLVGGWSCAYIRALGTHLFIYVRILLAHKYEFLKYFIYVNLPCGN